MSFACIQVPALTVDLPLGAAIGDLDGHALEWDAPSLIIWAR